MSTTPPHSVVAAFQKVTHADATRPLLTYYDDATGERLDLSGATLANWVAKTANLLTDGHGLGPGDTAVVDLPPHWQSAVVLLGCWSAGLTVAPRGGRGEVAFVAAGAPTPSADEIYALALAPLGAPFRPGPPDGTLDYVVEVRPYGDHHTAAVDPASAALADGTTHADLVARAGAAHLPSDRVLISATATADPCDWLVTPLVAGASVVLCANLDPARLDSRLATERATRWPG
jgi:uncharacterized protein (TIGR03089 family)